jgi:Holliday junction resolvasome RuvABC endonuclease subunit
MPIKESVILALDPGTREMGVAVLQGDELLDYRVKTFRNGRKVKDLLIQAAECMNELLDLYKPDVVVIEKPFFAKTKRSALLVFLVQELRRGARARGAALKLIGPLEVRARLLENSKATKRDVARKVIERFPELREHFHPGDHWRERYWGHVFDAVALGLFDVRLP